MHPIDKIIEHFEIIAREAKSLDSPKSRESYIGSALYIVNIEFERIKQKQSTNAPNPSN